MLLLGTYKRSPYPQRTLDAVALDIPIINGKATCPVCGIDIKVGTSGLPNLLKQHNPGKSKVCQYNQKKKADAKTQPSQPSILSFFTKPKDDLIPPTVPAPSHVIAYAIDPRSSGLESDETPTCSQSNGHVLGSHISNILMKLEKVISTLPGPLPNAAATDNLTFLPTFPTGVDRDDAWEFILEPCFSRFLGFGTSNSIAEVSATLHGCERELVGLERHLRDFTNWFKVSDDVVGLLEGKVKHVIKAIEM
jgi:hypothetical protein